MRVELEPETAILVREAVDSGDYKTASEVVSQAVQAWAAGDLLGYSSTELLRLADEGLASGSGRFANMDEIKAEVLRRAGVRPQDG